MPFVRLELLEKREAAHLRQLQVEDHAVVALPLELLECVLAGCHCDHLDVLAASDQVDDGLALRLVVLDDEQALEVAVDEAQDLAERLAEELPRDRLLDEGDGSRAERVLP